MNLLNALNSSETISDEPRKSSTKKTFRNPKDGKEITTELTEQQAVQILESQQSDFAKSLCSQWKQYGRLSEAQWYWFFKLAEENKPIPPVQLLSNLQEFCSKAPTLQFRVELEDKAFGKLLIRGGKVVQCAYRKQGELDGDKFYPTHNCLDQVKSFLFLMSADPYNWMLQHGKDTGVCCVCGAELTNEVSVARGIGPICAGRFE